MTILCIANIKLEKIYDDWTTFRAAIGKFIIIHTV